MIRDTAFAMTSLPTEYAVRPSAPESLGGKACPVHRGYSDSVVGGRLESAALTGTPSNRPTNALPGLPLQCPSLVDTTRNTISSQTNSTVSPRVKARQGLQLPSFQALGIANPHPGALPTPPEDRSFALAPVPPVVPGELPRSISFPDHIVQTAPEMSEPKAEPNSAVSKDMILATNQILPTDDQETPRAEIPVREPTESEVELVQLPRIPEYLAEALNVATSEISARPAPVTHLVRQTQPSPLRNVDGTAMTAYHILLERLQQELGSDHYIEVTYAVPARFPMDQLPSSPATTPSTSGTDTPDYFNMTVFTKGVVATDHTTAMAQGLPSSPHPVAVPNTVHISLLERYIPPFTLAEYKDLFSTEMHSALVDRLYELAPHSTLIFIYPTSTGARQFSSRYLAPLLDPTVRSLISVHNMAPSLGMAISKSVPADQLDEFDPMKRKLALLLRKLSRPASTRRTAVSYSLQSARSATVDLDRESWQTWWNEQEAGRIRRVLDSYWRQGFRVPHDSAMNAGLFTHEILNGVQKRGYAEYDLPREGVEVGIFVVKRMS